MRTKSRSFAPAFVTGADGDPLTLVGAQPPTS